MKKESSVGKRIRTYRERLDMSIYDLSQKCGIDEKVINSIEKGEVLPALGVLTKISRALGQRLGTFMDDQFKPDPIITRASDLEAGKVAGEGVNTLGYSSHSPSASRTATWIRSESNSRRMEWTKCRPTKAKS